MSPRTQNTFQNSPVSGAIGCLGQSILSQQQWQELAHRLALSDRELQAVQAIFDDQTEAAIAGALGISRHTVHTHLERLYRKLGVACRCAAVVRVFAEYLSLEDHHQGSTDQPNQPMASSAPAGLSAPRSHA